MKNDNGQSAAKVLSSTNIEYEQSSTTIPRKGSTLDKSLLEKEWFLLSDWKACLPVSGIYCIKNNINNKLYVGISKNIKKRSKEHFYLSKNIKVRGNSKLKNAIMKHGVDNFYITILEETSENLIEKEAYYINNYSSIKEGYNIKTYDVNYKESYKKSDFQKELELANRYKNKIGVKSVLVFDLKGNLINRFDSRVLAAKFYNYNRRTLTESVVANIKVIAENKESFYRCFDYIFIDEGSYDNRFVNYIEFKNRAIIKNNIPYTAIELSKKPVCFIDGNNVILSFSSLKEGLDKLNIKRTTYYKHKDNLNYLFNSKYKLIKNKI